MPTTQTLPKTQKKARSRRKKITRRTSPRYGGLTLEISVKILVKLMIATAAISALNKLIPHYRVQVSRIAEIEQEVNKTQQRVEKLNNEFTRHFDPYQSEEIMMEQTNQTKPNQRRIVWLK